MNYMLDEKLKAGILSRKLSTQVGSKIVFMNSTLKAQNTWPHLRTFIFRHLRIPPDRNFSVYVNFTHFWLFPIFICTCHSYRLTFDRFSLEIHDKRVQQILLIEKEISKAQLKANPKKQS